MIDDTVPVTVPVVTSSAVTSSPASGRSRMQLSVPVVAEIGVALSTPVLFVFTCRSIDVNPLDPIGKVSGLAALQFRFAGFAVVLLVALVVAARSRRPGVAALVPRLACGGVAGLVSGLLAGGVVVALHGTSWGFLADRGDAGQFIKWAQDVLDGHSLPRNYPPLQAYTIAGISQLTGQPPGYAMKTFEIAGAAIFCPCAYLSWRLVLTPLWALLIGVTAALPMYDSRPVADLVLVVLVPVLIKFVEVLRGAPDRSTRSLVLAGVGFGLGIGFLFEVYYGWYVWSAPGVVLACAFVVPWGRPAARRAAAVLLGSTAATFCAVTAYNLLPLLTGDSKVKDTYFYFDIYTQPAYFTHWFGDRPPTTLGMWPQVGDLGGVDLFTILLFVGFAAALALGRGRSPIVVVSLLVGSAWLVRFYIAQQMFHTQSVQFYPRTNYQLLYGMLLMTGFALMYGARHVRTALAGRMYRRDVAFNGPALASVLTGTMFLFASIGGATMATFMPKNDKSAGTLAYAAQTIRKLDGRCPYFAVPPANEPLVLRVKVRTDHDPSCVPRNDPTPWWK
ncbi:hypothetical protein [Catenulispora sp. GAS73]|uniref:hypothetical protein n=1 Tax=Catenulispora sp. GAS73 TaxID=3156269 RepID=UPI003516BC93